MTHRKSYTANIQPNGQIICPIAGTVRWAGGKATGVWGRDFKIEPMLLNSEGEVRNLNAVEKILYADQIARLPL